MSDFLLGIGKTGKSPCPLEAYHLTMLILGNLTVIAKDI